MCAHGLAGAYAFRARDTARQPPSKGLGSLPAAATLVAGGLHDSDGRAGPAHVGRTGAGELLNFSLRQSRKPKG